MRIERRKNGRFYVRFKDERGEWQKESLHTNDKGEADRNFQDWIKLRITESQATTTVGAVWERYTAAKKGQASDATRTTRWKALAPRFAHLYPDQITEEACKEYFKDRRDRGGVKLNTVWGELNVLRTALNWGHRKELIEKKPHVWVPPQGKRGNRHLTKEEVKALLDATQHFHVRLFIILAVSTAGRMSAILELTWDRVDFTRDRIDLATRESDEESRKGRALVPMTSTARTILLAARERAMSKYVVEWGGDKVGKIIFAIRATAERAGLGRVTPHMLRHTAAVWMAEAGVPMSQIAQYLGHANSKITESTYARYSPTFLKGAAAALELT